MIGARYYGGLPVALGNIKTTNSSVENWAQKWSSNHEHLPQENNQIFLMSESSSIKEAKTTLNIMLQMGLAVDRETAAKINGLAQDEYEKVLNYVSFTLQAHYSRYGMDIGLVNKHQVVFKLCRGGQQPSANRSFCSSWPVWMPTMRAK
jgi:hypothetical protein